MSTTKKEEQQKKNSKARIDANNRYADKTYDRISLVIPKGQKEIIAEFAQKHGESINGYISRAINTQINNEKQG